MCRNVNELCQIVVTEHSLEMIHLGISAVIVMKVKIARQYKITVGICKLCEKLSSWSYKAQQPPKTEWTGDYW